MHIVLNESNASRRSVPIMCFQSDGSSAATFESGRTFMFSMGGVFYGSGGSISAVSSVDGMYMCNFSASKVSVLGQGMVQYSSNTALPWMTPFEVIATDPWTSGVTLLAGAYSDVTVRIAGVSYSGLTIDGVRFVGTSGERSMASSLLSTNMGANRYVQEAFFALRNRYTISGLTLTVYHPDDTTSSWTGTVSTGTLPIAGLDPGGL